MHSLLYKISAHPKYSKIYTWGKLISITGGAQIIVQLLGLLCGIIIIRLLPTEEYAYYTLANTVLGTMTVLADGGISNSVMAQGGKVWQDKHQLGKVIATGLSLRRTFGVVTLIIVAPIFISLLLKHGASWFTTVLIFVSLIPSFFAALSDSLLEVVLKLKQDILSLQKNQLNASVGRFLLQAIGLLFFPLTWITLLGNGISRIYANNKLRKISSTYTNLNQNPDPIVQKEILKIVKRTMPESIYYCLSGQLTIWVVSLFGSTISLASLGAISRINALLNLFAIVFVTLIAPRFARAADSRRVLCRYVSAVFFGNLILALIVVSITWVFSHQLLWILGDKYSNLNAELLLSMLVGCATLLQGCFFSLLTNRGWPINPVLYIAISLIITGLCAALINISTIKGVLIFNLLISSTQAIILIAYCFFRINKVMR